MADFFGGSIYLTVRLMGWGGMLRSCIPDFVFRYFEKPFVWFASNMLTTKTPMGRKVGKAVKGGKGAPLIGISMKDIQRAGIRDVPRIVGTRDGWPVTEDGLSLPVYSIIWATGFQPDYGSWINIEGCLDEQGYPLTERGVSMATAGLYFVGSTFQFGLTSAWMAGVGRDAEFVCRALAARINFFE
jgi:putative flavoprotein involved in K+ transport